MSSLLQGSKALPNLSCSPAFALLTFKGAGSILVKLHQVIFSYPFMKDCWLSQQG